MKNYSQAEEDYRTQWEECSFKGCFMHYLISLLKSQGKEIGMQREEINALKQSLQFESGQKEENLKLISVNLARGREVISSQKEIKALEEKLVEFIATENSTLDRAIAEKDEEILYLKNLSLKLKTTLKEVL